MDVRRDVPRIPSTHGGSPDDDDDASTLTEQDRRALEAIQRQLDIEFGQPPSWDPLQSRAGAGEVAPPEAHSRRAWRVAAVAGRMLVWVTAGALVTIVYVKHAGPRGTGDQAVPSLQPAATVTPVLAPVPPPPAISAPSPRPVVAAIPRAVAAPGGMTAAPSGGRTYWVQVGAFRNADSAKRLAARLRGQDPPAKNRRVVVTYGRPGGSSLARVRVGPFATREEAAARLRALRTLGYEPAIAEERG